MCTCVIFSAPLQSACVPCHVLRDTVWGHCFGPFCWGLGETVCSSHFTMSTQTPGARKLSDHHEPKTRISTFSVPNFYVGCPEFWSRIFRPNFSPEFFVGFPAVAAILRPEKKNQGENQGTCAPARAGWCESFPKLVAEAPQILELQEWRTLAAVGLLCTLKLRTPYSLIFCWVGAVGFFS